MPPLLARVPLGIDHGLIVRLGRYVLATVGISPRWLQVSVREQLEGKTGNTSKIPLPALLDTLEFLAGELDDSLGIKVSFPVDQAGREYIFFTAVSDYIMESDTLLGEAAVLYAAGDWTTGHRNATSTGSTTGCSTRRHWND